MQTPLLPPCASSLLAPAAPPPPAAARYVVLTGNPNSGKTTVFNALTGLRAKVANYAGVTVERKEGRLQGTPRTARIQVLDLPGTYSLSPHSLDEQIARDVLLHRLPELPPPAVVVVVADASNLQRHLYYATQVIELGYPTIVALNLMDVARDNSHEIDVAGLAARLGVPVIPLVASAGEGIPELRQKILDTLATGNGNGPPRRFCELPEVFTAETRQIAALLAECFQERRAQAEAEALLILSNEKALASSTEHYPASVQEAVAAARQRLEAAGVDWPSAAIAGRYAVVAEICRQVVRERAVPGETWSDRLDRVLTHRVWGTAVLVLVLLVIFQSIFTLAQFPMHALEHGVGWVGAQVARVLPPGDLRSLLVDGVIAGVGAVVVFLPQIMILFFFIGLLEDTGYMARAAFLMDRLMSKVGLHGKSFIPLLSSFACAIPGIMATRTIETAKDRLVTILIAPLMSCSARLPVYTLLIAAVIPPETRVLGFLKLSALTLLGMYALGIVAALVMAWIFKKTLLRGQTPLLIMELPPYKRPALGVTLHHMWVRAKIFLRQAGTVILGINILLWFLATYPRLGPPAEPAAVAADVPSDVLATSARTGDPEDTASEQLRHSFAGRLGRAIEPIIAPLGFDWKMGIGIVTSFAAREVFVSTMSTIYNVAEADDSAEATRTLAEKLRAQRRPDGTPLYTPLLGITLMVFYVFALQCASTVAVVRRETNSWKWPLFQWLYMGALAWVMAFLTWQGGRLLGWQ